MRKANARKIRQGAIIALVCLIPFMLAAVVRSFRLLEVIELKTLDRRWQVADLQPPPHPRDLVLVTLDARTEAVFGSRLLWTPGDYRPLIATLQQAHPAAILLMVWLNREWPEDQAPLPGEGLLVLRPYYIRSSHWRQGGFVEVAQWAPVIPNLREAEVKSFSNFPLDPVDGIYRTAQLVVRSRDGQRLYHSLELHAALRKWQIPPTTLQLQRNPWLGWRLQAPTPGKPQAIPLDDQGRLWIRYRGGLEKFDTISAVDVLDLFEHDSEALFRRRFKDKIVVIGATTQDARLALTPRGRLNALEMRANAIATLLEEDFVTRWTPLADLSYLAFWAFVAVCVAWVAHFRGRGTLWIASRHALMFTIHLGWCLLAFLLWRWWIDFTSPSLAIVSGGAVTALYLAYLRIDRVFRELRTTQQQLVRSEKEAAYGAMAAQVRHELRNILNSIRSPAEMVRNNFERGDPLQLADHPEEIVAEMNVIIERVNKLTEMIENELSFFQNSQYRFHPHALETVVRESLDMAQDAIRAAKVEVRVEIPPAFPEVEIDADKLKIALLNLIRNACEAMPRGGVLTIRAKQQESDRYQIQILDTGRGIFPGQIEQIFEPFFTTKARGLGLGLANVKNIVEGHGGTIQVKSAPGEGTCFTLLLPVHPMRDQVQ